MSNTNQTTPNTAAHSNIQGALDTFYRSVDKLGAESVNIARPKLGLELAVAAHQGIIGDDDVAGVYERYLSARNTRRAKNALAAAIGDEGGSTKAQVSKCRQIVKMSSLPDVNGPVLLANAMEILKDVSGGEAKVFPPFDVMVSVSREQLKDASTPLSDDTIRALCLKPEARSKDEVEKLCDCYKTAAKLWEALPNVAPLEDAVHSLKDAIVAAGGTVPPVTKEEQKLATFMKNAAKMGITIIPAAAPDLTPVTDEMVEAVFLTDEEMADELVLAGQ